VVARLLQAQFAQLGDVAVALQPGRGIARGEGVARGFLAVLVRLVALALASATRSRAMASARARLRSEAACTMQSVRATPTCPSQRSLATTWRLSAATTSAWCRALAEGRYCASSSARAIRSSAPASARHTALAWAASDAQRASAER
jgi:hypothetical protein